MTSTTCPVTIETDPANRFPSGSQQVLRGEQKRKLCLLEQLSTRTSPSSERQKVWSKDLSLTLSRAGTDQSCLALRTESTLSHPKISDKIIESNLLGGMKKSDRLILDWMRRDGDEIHFKAPLPTASNRREAQFQQRCAKGTMGLKSYHQSQKFAQARCYLPKVTRIIFFKKMGGISTICMRPFVRGKSIVKNFVSFNMLHVVW